MIDWPPFFLLFEKGAGGLFFTCLFLKQPQTYLYYLYYLPKTPETSSASPSRGKRAKSALLRLLADTLLLAGGLFSPQSRESPGPTWSGASFCFFRVRKKKKAALGRPFWGLISYFLPWFIWAATSSAKFSSFFSMPSPLR